MKLTEKDAEIFAKALLNDDEPTKEAKDAAKKYMSSKYHTSECWYNFLGNVEIIDPDGWDRINFQHSWYEEQITFEEFYDRLIKSTIKWKE